MNNLLLRLGVAGYYDIDNDRIMNCQVGSVFWWHERGHQLQNKKGWFNLRPLFLICLHYAVVFLAFGKADIAQLFALCWLLPELIFEIDAWVFALKALHDAGVEPKEKGD